MTSRGDRSRPEAEREAARIDEFLQRFFGEGNDAGRYPGVIAPFIQSLRRGDDAPAVLPRFVEERGEFALYVIAADTAQVMPVADLIEAFAGPTYCLQGDTAPAELDPRDPVDAAVIDFAGANRTFVVQTGPTPEQRARLRAALTLMQTAVAARPARLWRIPRPIGRLLAEFDASLSAGGEAASLTVLDQLVAQGGITATNLAYLRIKRLDRLGRSKDLLSMDGLANVLRQDPPLPVKEAVLNAIYSALLEEPLRRGDVTAACDALRNADRPLPLPVHDAIAQYSDEAAATLLTAAIGRRDMPALQRMASTVADTDRVSALPRPLWEETASVLGQPDLLAPGMPGEQAPEQPDTPPGDEAAATRADVRPDADHLASDLPPAGEAVPESWPALCRAVADELPMAKAILREEAWRDWPSPAESDGEISQILEGLDDSSWALAWQVTGPFIQAVGYGAPAPLTARSLITYALAFDRLGPGDLIAIQALTEICLRASPSAPAYRDLLDELGGSCPQWVSPENALVALDFADRLVLAACPDDSARMNLAIALLDPLNSRQGRLEESDLAFASQLSGELAIPLDWQAPAELPDEVHPLAGLPPMTVLLYSLDHAVLDRTSAELQRLAPRLKISTSHDKTATDALKKKSRNADVVVLATRCAKHAATGFITENAHAAVITYADGSGSASLLRAATDGLGRAALPDAVPQSRG
jgi:hypothetical protein